MKYFLHDTSAFEDEKITELFLKFGYTGLGLFYTALEKIAKQEKPIKTNILKSQLKINKRLDKCWHFMEQIGLIVSSNEESFNENLMFRCRLYDTQKLSTKKRVAEWRERQKDSENVTRYERVSNADKVNKVNKVNKERNIIPPPLDLIISYCKERGNKIDPNYFFDYNEACGWQIKGKLMKDWQACIRYWERNNFKNRFKKESSGDPVENFMKEMDEARARQNGN